MSKSSVKIRDAGVEDLNVIFSLITQKAEFDGGINSFFATTEQLKQTLFGNFPLARVLLAEIEEEVVGYALFFATYSSFLAQPSIWIDDLFVILPKRGQGIGTALLNHLAKIAQAQNYGRLEWTVNKNNHRAIAFYQQLGAKILEPIKLCRLNQTAIDQLASYSNR
ncbi:GCN5-related N-acetyltransferase [Stanieria cyanosphaera PCC 7437]|uniref:GCN5-related N-acetyltransferase n=1 Tax=Stanieria cyanosphaera (strain ATCC 29371 / PCC 7437) TaxID=111780 RepID=K9XVU8_STAC7|nr:GNAT family N-acetyltransferase [Stanieria cyanosphaera]AFZ36715.1 GCN5-related N-acetyltransferase [Stanieria cyanosphaera PCC 7437]